MAIHDKVQLGFIVKTLHRSPMKKSIKWLTGVATASIGGVIVLSLIALIGMLAFHLIATPLLNAHKIKAENQKLLENLGRSVGKGTSSIHELVTVELNYPGTKIFDGWIFARKSLDVIYAAGLRDGDIETCIDSNRKSMSKMRPRDIRIDNDSGVVIGYRSRHFLVLAFCLDKLNGTTLDINAKWDYSVDQRDWDSSRIGSFLKHSTVRYALVSIGESVDDCLVRFNEIFTDYGLKNIYANDHLIFGNSEAATAISFCLEGRNKTEAFLVTSSLNKDIATELLESLYSLLQ